MFLALLYVRYWNRSSVLFDAAINDLNFLKELEEYAAINNQTSTVAIQAISRHLHYLSEELVVLCIFSEKLSVDEKIAIAINLLQIDDTKLVHCSFHFLLRCLGPTLPVLYQ